MSEEVNMTQVLDMIGIRKGDEILTLAGTCECDRFVCTMDDTLEWATNIAVFCGYCV
jgi:hypothetical protein